MIDVERTGCAACREGKALDFEIAMAFQPIVDVETNSPWAYEALVRGADGAGAGAVLARVTDDIRYAFDQRCRVAAIEGAVAAGILATGARLSINFLPNAVYSPRACIQLTLKTAAATKFPTDRLVFEFTENERMSDPAHVAEIVTQYRAMGFGVAIDDFGAGFAGLGLLSRFQPDFIKIDMELIRDLDRNVPRRMIVASIVRMCHDMGLTVIAEGVETRCEAEQLRAMGVRLMQGYLFAKPGFRALPPIAVPRDVTMAEAA